MHVYMTYMTERGHTCHSAHGEVRGVTCERKSVFHSGSGLEYTHIHTVRFMHRRHLYPVSISLAHGQNFAYQRPVSVGLSH